MDDFHIVPYIAAPLPSQADSARVKPTQHESSRVKPSQAESSRVNVGLNGAAQAKSN
jgi:hypothetical protein